MPNSTPSGPPSALARPTPAPGAPAGPTCLVGAVLARVPAGPRQAPAQPRRHQGRGLVHARPAAGRTASGPAAAAAAGAPARPRRPRRQEATEPVPLHGGGRSYSPAPALGPTRPRSAPLGPIRPGSAPLGPIRPGSASLGSARLRSALRCTLGPASGPGSVLLGPEPRASAPLDGARPFPLDAAAGPRSAPWKRGGAEQGGAGGAMTEGRAGEGKDQERGQGRHGQRPRRLACHRRRERVPTGTLTRSQLLREAT